ncbi:hypothetical protein AB0M54_44275 [Actinoplanes sp. NPDC051470]|uniref:hypothetical protein n=1 Tax=Actinoplanes sp. NPDC051470 TaxID=3157224 RepID=UPI003447EA8B
MTQYGDQPPAAAARSGRTWRILIVVAALVLLLLLLLGLLAFCGNGTTPAGGPASSPSFSYPPVTGSPSSPTPVDPPPESPPTSPPGKPVATVVPSGAPAAGGGPGGDGSMRLIVLGGALLAVAGGVGLTALRRSAG